MLAKTASAAAPPGKRLNPPADQPSQGRALRSGGVRPGWPRTRAARSPLGQGPGAHQWPNPSRATVLAPARGLGRRGRAQEGILAGDDHQSGDWDRREIRAPLPSDVHGRTVGVEDAISHGAVAVRCQVEGRVLGHPEHLENTGPLLRRCPQLLSPEVFTRLWYLPDLGEVMPLVARRPASGADGHDPKCSYPPHRMTVLGPIGQRLRRPTDRA
jgi:hypothetical protein